MKKGLLLATIGTFLSLVSFESFAQCGTTPHPGDLIISSNTSLSGIHNVAGIFRVDAGATLTVTSYANNGCGELVINASSIEVIGNIIADGAGFIGGAGGAGGAGGNNSGALTGCTNKDNCLVINVDPGTAGAAGSGPGAGTAGVAGTQGSGSKQQCQNVGDTYGYVAGAGGAGGAGGGSYGGVALAGGTGGNGGAYNAGLFNPTSLASCASPTAGNGGNGGGVGAGYGTLAGTDIALGSGGAGAGGGGKSSGNGGSGGNGGNGGGLITLNSTGTLSIVGTISALGTAGGVGGNGGNGGRSPKCCSDGCSGCDEETFSAGAGSGAGGGGGSGGGILISADGLATITGTLRTSGGNGGAGGANGAGSSTCNHSSFFCSSTGGSSTAGTAGNQGGGGSGGRIKIFTSPCYANVVTPNTQVTGGSGQGGAAGVGTVHIGSLPGIVPPTASTSVTNALCFGNANGQATITVSGGVAPFTFTWPVGAANTSAGATSTGTGLAAGTYDVTIQDAGGCSILETVSIGEPAILTGQIFATIDADCFGAATGEASVTALGGTSPYTYAWNDPNSQITQTAVNLPSGTYTVTITDFNNCGGTAQVTISDPAPFAATVTVVQNVSCNGANDGQATVNVVGTPAVTFLWNDPLAQTAATAGNLPAGTWQCVVASSLTCDTIVSVTITQPGILTPVAVQASQVSCTGGNNGVASVTQTGGTGPFSYLWNDPSLAITPTVGNLAIGTYNVIVTDANQCTANASVTITEPAPINIVLDVQNAACFNTASGQITANVNGGTGAYSYLWTPGNLTGQTITGITAGSYSVTVTDANNCTSTFNNIIVGQPTQVVANVSQLSNISCFGENDGSIATSVSGGNAPYTYQWNDPTVQTTSAATNLSPGNYGVVVLDANNCPATIAGLVISEPTVLASTVAQTTDVTCAGGADGVAQVNVTGGTLPYNYLWSDGQQSSTAIGLTEGSYTVAITDANGCATAATATIDAPIVPFVASFTVSPETGLQPLDITITNTTIGGTSYEWFFGDGSQITSNTLDAFGYMYADSGAFDILLVAYDANTGCVDSVLLQNAVYITPTSALNVPNVITPNGDGINDMFPIDPTQDNFFPFEIRNIKSFRGQIYNRWGQLVYEWTQPLGGWEGRSLSGVPVEPATYFYAIDAVGIDGESETKYMLKGNVLVVR